MDAGYIIYRGIGYEYKITLLVIMLIIVLFILLHASYLVYVYLDHTWYIHVSIQQSHKFIEGDEYWMEPFL